MGVECRRWSTLGSGFVPGQLLKYSGPSKSPSESVHPLSGMRDDRPAVKQKLSSSSGPLGSVELADAQTPVPLRMLAPFTFGQYSKWPISSEKAMLYECAAHTTRVCSLEVL